MPRPGPRTAYLTTGASPCLCPSLHIPSNFPPAMWTARSRSPISSGFHFRQFAAALCGTLGANFDVIKQQKYLARTLLSLETAMANKNDFTPEEWTKVLESIIAAGIAVSAVDPSGLWGTLKEAAAGTPALAAAKRDPNSNELIKAAVADFERSDDGSILAMRERFAQAEPTECVQRSLASLREVSAIVDAKAPDEAAAFKTWLREISQKVAEAAVEGSFLGFGGVRVSDAETATLRDISKALGMAS